MENERQIGLKMFEKFINKKDAEEIEEILYNYSENNDYKYMAKLKYLFVYTYAKKQKLIPRTKPIPIEFMLTDSKVLVMLFMAFNKSKNKN